MSRAAINACATVSSSLVIVATERNKTLRLNNSSRVPIAKVRVDGCLITGTTIRCDYLFEIDNPIREIIYVELKGRDIPHAIAQLENTLIQLRPHHNGFNKKCFIICSSVPRSTPSTQALQTKFRRLYNADIKIRENSYEHSV